jgi:lipopolysaccharide export system protein LptA
MKPANRRIVVPIAASLLALFACPLSLHAQGLALGNPTDRRPVDVRADSGIEWQQNAQVYIARGNAVATRGNTELHADTLTAHYRQAKGKDAASKGSLPRNSGIKDAGETDSGTPEIYRINADGHVLIKGETQDVAGDRAVYDLDQGVVVVTGTRLKLTTPTDVVTARDSLEWYDQKQIAVARGDAVAVRAAKRIRADVLTAHLVRNAPATGSGAAGQGAPKSATGRTATKPSTHSEPSTAGGEGSRISRIDAEGHVLVSTATDVGRSDYGVYDADRGIVTLLGNVTLTRGQNTIRGEYAVMDLNTNVSRMMTVARKQGGAPHRVEGLFVREDRAATRGRSASPGAAKR